MSILLILLLHPTLCCQLNGCKKSFNFEFGSLDKNIKLHALHKIVIPLHSCSYWYFTNIWLLTAKLEINQGWGQMVCKIIKQKLDFIFFFLNSFPGCGNMWEVKKHHWVYGIIFANVKTVEDLGAVIYCQLCLIQQALKNGSACAGHTFCDLISWHWRKIHWTITLLIIYQRQPLFLSKSSDL